MLQLARPTSIPPIVYHILSSYKIEHQLHEGNLEEPQNDAPQTSFNTYHIFVLSSNTCSCSTTTSQYRTEIAVCQNYEGQNQPLDMERHSRVWFNSFEVFAIATFG